MATKMPVTGRPDTEPRHSKWRKVTEIYKCENGCGFYRCLSSITAQQELKFDHAVYGTVSYKQAAELDIRLHDCDLHKIALEKLHA